MSKEEDDDEWKPACQVNRYQTIHYTNTKISANHLILNIVINGLLIIMNVI